MAQLAGQEVSSLKQARELFASEHYDLCVIESWRALEARLRQVLLVRRLTAKAEDPQSLVRVAARKGILREPTLGRVNELKRHWAVAVSTDPLPREAAVEALSTVRHALAVIPVKEPHPSKPEPTGSPGPPLAPV